MNNARSRPLLPRLPPHPPGLRIGLLGGSFDPPHAGHLAISRIALRRLRLDRLWWLVTPGNPLKEGPAALDARIDACRALAKHPRIVVTGVEAQIRTRFTYDTLRHLRRRCPGVQFVWIMGADNLLSFHRWRHWRDIADLVPIAVIDRPGATLKTESARTAQALRKARWPEGDAAIFAQARPPALLILHARRSALSSTALRASRGP
ncbi:nicotinate-nucleotide adenylyltransferase [Methylocystis bryophila]|uniref:Probable nicotinate-nucleotide adenylyltransferase n=1 Tax=Methylocystis bryophila TaxID=655015 RepID=A0A1W6MRR6_9HYPH|nr:nicotinate-nucleotide adenylyltransferase [Methylocystis bryophila]ARN80293.1 nicotinic acid mononucleotide adenylyltransferase [Methylocystis bryophila]BDV40264.1 putative nicotinate-nucleotide adenylyltransferase [Methylocystis bryophila]